MSKISCNIIRDLLPLYVDDVAGDDTCHLVSDHLARCPACRRKYETMKSEVVIPLEGDARLLKQFKQARKREKNLIAFVSVLLTILVTITGMMVYENVSVVHDFFSPAILATMRWENGSEEWRRLPVGETGYLCFDSIFYHKQMVLDGNCQEGAVFRILDEQGNVVLDCLALEPGTGFSLEELERNQNYIVEILTAAKHCVVRFF